MSVASDGSLTAAGRQKSRRESAPKSAKWKIGEALFVFSVPSTCLVAWDGSGEGVAGLHQGSSSLASLHRTRNPRFRSTGDDFGPPFGDVGLPPLSCRFSLEVWGAYIEEGDGGRRVQARISMEKR